MRGISVIDYNKLWVMYSFNSLISSYPSAWPKCNPHVAIVYLILVTSEVIH